MSVVSPQNFVLSLTSQLDKLCQQKATGELRFYDRQKKVAIMFLLGGRLQYTTPIIHRRRHWQRAVLTHCPQWQQPEEIKTTRPWECDFIYQGVSKRQVSLDQAKSMITMVTDESLLELALLPELKIEWQDTDRQKSTFSYFLSLASEDIHSLLEEIKQEQREWLQNKLHSLHPCISPTLTDKGRNLIKKPLQLKYLSGDYTIWDFAVKSKQPIVKVAKSLQEWQTKGLIDFRELDDLSFNIKDSRRQTKAKNSTVSVSPKSSTAKVDSSTSQENRVKTVQNVNTNSGQHRQHKYLIACIDDSSIIIRTLSKILVPAGFDVLGIEEPMAGFAQLLEHQPDLILLDLNMPNANGYSVCKFLRESPIFAKTPIIILTAQDRSIDRAKAKLVGATDFLNKPPEAKTLITLINNYIEKQKTKVG